MTALSDQIKYLSEHRESEQRDAALATLVALQQWMKAVAVLGDAALAALVALQQWMKAVAVLEQLEGADAGNDSIMLARARATALNAGAALFEAAGVNVKEEAR